MKRLLRLELKKALKNRFFVLSVSIMTLFAVLSAVYMYQNNSAVLYGIVGERFAENGKLIDNPMLSLLGFYNAWVGGEIYPLRTRCSIRSYRSQQRCHTRGRFS